MKKVKYLFIFGLLAFLAGCEDFLKEEPKTFTSPAALMKSRDGVEQAVNGIYNAMTPLCKYRYYLMNYSVTTDEIVYIQTTSDRLELQSYLFSANNANLRLIWQTDTYGINRANLVLDNLPASGSLGIADEQQFLNFKKGEALFFRAWFYYHQVMAFGSVPLITKFYDAELFPSNAPIADIFTRIITDLKDAELLLPNWKDSYAQKGRITRGAAKALLGKVYLAKASSVAKETNDYQNAVLKLKDVIDNEGYGLWNKYSDVFIPANKNNKEDIFSFQFQANTFLMGSQHADFTPLISPDGIVGYNNFRLTDTLYNSFEPGDGRLSIILKGQYTIPNGQVLQTPNNKAYTMKYRDPVNSLIIHNNLSTNTPFIRYADVLLCYAEAINEANNGPTQPAYDAINTVRARVGLSALSGLTKAQFFKAIVHERFVEFHAEGLRWIDLKRWGLLKEKVESAKPGVTVQWPKHSVFPIPQQEIDANPNLQQNEGY